MSNRFRNLKLGSTFKLASNRLAPLHEPGDKAATISNSPRVRFLTFYVDFIHVYRDI